MNWLMIVFLFGIVIVLGGCVNLLLKLNDLYYVLVLLCILLFVVQNNGVIYQVGFEQNFYDDCKVFCVGDIIIIIFNEKIQVSKKVNFDIQKDSKIKMGLILLFGSGMIINNLIGGGDFSFSVEYGGLCDVKGDSQVGQSNSLIGLIIVIVVEVLFNGIFFVCGEKWMILNIGNELVCIVGLVCVDDIVIDNIVFLICVVDVWIIYFGIGVFVDVSQLGWLDCFFFSLLWLF